MLAAAAPIVALGLANGLYLERLTETPPLYWAADLTQWVVVPVICLAALARFAGVTPRDYGLRAPDADLPALEMAAITALAGVVLTAVYFASSSLAWLVIPGTEPTFSYSALVPDGLMKGVVVAYFALTAGVVEEIAFRGLPLAALQVAGREQIPTTAYVLGTSVLFALIHWENGPPELAATFVYGAVAALLYLKLANLWPLVLGHVAVDVISFW